MSRGAFAGRIGLYRFFQRDLAAFFAIALRLAALRDLALAARPFLPPIMPKGYSVGTSLVKWLFQRSAVHVLTDGTFHDLTRNLHKIALLA
jgi:hypothetical protein